MKTNCQNLQEDGSDKREALIYWIKALFQSLGAQAETLWEAPNIKMCNIQQKMNLIWAETLKAL